MVYEFSQCPTLQIQDSYHSESSSECTFLIAEAGGPTIDFSGKGPTLQSLQGKLSTASIPPFFLITWEQWTENRGIASESINRLDQTLSFIVRSSARSEDGSSRSEAGQYLSLGPISVEAIPAAIDSVFASYHEELPDNQVIVQRFLDNTLCSGVIFTHNPSNGAPYRIINWTESNDTALVTSGRGGQVWQQVPESLDHTPAKLHGLNDLVNELLECFENRPLDIEFAIGHVAELRTIFLLQVRPLHVQSAQISEGAVIERHQHIRNRVRRGGRQVPRLLGSTTVFGVMPDWNPAEIIGIRPKPLSLSLYRDLITDSIWSYQRSNYGYRNLRGFPLMTSFLGLPYIDTRVSFNSLVPAQFPEEAAEKLVESYLYRLKSEPWLHDKIEFKIALSVLDFDEENFSRGSQDAGLTAREVGLLRDSLRAITGESINLRTGHWISDRDRVRVLCERYDAFREASEDMDVLSRIFWLLEDAKRYGTLPFSGLARAAFMSVQILKSMVTAELISESQLQIFMSSISTVTSSLQRDKTDLSQVDFLNKYGHLRPGTYDILSPRYDEDPLRYFEWGQKSATAIQREEPTSFEIDPMTESRVSKAFKEIGLPFDARQFFLAAKTTIELRESCKFFFTRNVSDALQLIGKYAGDLGFSLEEVALMNIFSFQELQRTADDPKRALQLSLDAGMKSYDETLSVSLPPLITAEQDVRGWYWAETQPTYVTLKTTEGTPATELSIKGIRNRIVFIPNADPGFDWIFAQDIRGLITAWGGANSHMAIRASELGVPAVIGVGEKHYAQWIGTQSLLIDCANQRVTVIQQ